MPIFIVEVERHEISTIKLEVHSYTIGLVEDAALDLIDSREREMDDRFAAAIHANGRRTDYFVTSVAPKKD